MSRSPLRFRLITLLLCVYAGCREKESTAYTKPHFSYFEMSYHGGWTGFLSIRADADKVFLSPRRQDTVAYGILPDSLMRLISKLVDTLKYTAAIKSDSSGCDDCAAVAVYAISGADTLSLFQSRNISRQVYELFEKTDAFLTSNRHRYFNAWMVLNTAKAVLPPPPPVIKK